MHTKKLLLTTTVLLVVLILLGPGASLAEPPAVGGSAPIKLKSGTIDTTQIAPIDLAGQVTSGPVAKDQPGTYIIQFSGPVQASWKAQVSAIGVELFDYLPDYAFKVRATPEQLLKAQSLKTVQWIGPFLDAYKLSPGLALGKTQLYKVRFESFGNADKALNAAKTDGVNVVQQGGQFAVVLANEAQLNALANDENVAWIENFVLYEKHNEYGAGVIMGANTANANGYDGSSQIAAVADTGFGGGTASTGHVDLPASRIVAIQDFQAVSDPGCYTVYGDGAQDVDSGHGTHVALSVVGDGGPGGIGKGTAPAAKLVFQAVEDYVDFVGFCGFFNPDGYYLLGLPTDMTNLYQPAYNVGARIHSNSWGSDAAGDYTADSASTDAFMWNNPDILITFSAGNAGVDANNNGVVDNDSIGSPATAKNVLTVGASENDRGGDFSCDTGLGYVSSDAYQSGETCSSMGGQNILGTAGQRWGFTTEPLNSDISAGNAEQMAPFSSRGPTDDGRIKPDVVAPGAWVLSGYSDNYQQGYDGSTNPQTGLYQSDGWGMPVSDKYKYFGGTSMANPLAAGGATVVRDYYNKAHSHNASAALVKATLINSAVDLLDENNDGSNDNDYPIPNVHEGWGRIDLANATDGSAQYVDNTTGLSTGNNASYQFSVSSSGNPLKVSLVWSDYPSTESAADNLVNNLNLVVTGPGGSPVYRGNVFSGGWSQTGGSADTVNNVENVYLQSAVAGTWTVQVSGANVPNGPQPFALVVDGTFGAAPTPTPTNTPVPPTATNTPTNTPVPPTATNTPTNTPVVPTATNTPTNTPVPPTATNTPTNTPVAPTATNTPTNTPVPPTATNTPTNTPVPPTPTNTPVGPTNTPTATNTPVPPTATNTPTNTPVPPTATNTPLPPTPTPTPGSGEVIYLSSSSGGNVGGVSFSDEDILAYDVNSDSWSAYFDGSDVGVKVDLDAFYLEDDGNILVSFNVAATISGLGTVDDSDILRFIPTQLGSSTSGSFEWYFDGSDVGLTTNGEDVDGLYLMSDGRLVISTQGGFNVPGVSGRDEDLLIFTPASLGESTSGSWAMGFDGSDVGLGSSGEDVWGVWVDSNNDIYLTTQSTFSVSGLSGDGDDIFVCQPGSTGSNTSCTFGSAPYWDGDQHGYGSERIDSFFIAR